MTALLRTYLALASAGCFLGAIVLAWRRLAAFSSGAAATGRVVGFAAREDDGTMCYLPVVTFTDVEGRSHQFTSPAGGTGSTHRLAPRSRSAIIAPILRRPTSPCFCICGRRPSHWHFSAGRPSRPTFSRCARQLIDARAIRDDHGDAPSTSLLRKPRTLDVASVSTSHFHPSFGSAFRCLRNLGECVDGQRLVTGQGPCHDGE